MGDDAVSKPTLPDKYLDRLVSVLSKLPVVTLQDRSVAYAILELWRKVPIETLPQSKYLKLWDRIWKATAHDSERDGDLEDPVFYAINNPAGQLTEEILKYLWPQNAKAGGGLPSELTSRLRKIIQRTDHRKIDASSIIVVSRTEILFVVDPNFTKENVLPLLSWQTNQNAAAYWSAFLWPARINPDLYKFLENDCLESLRNPGGFKDRTYEILCQLFLLASMEFKATKPETMHRLMAELSEAGLEHMSSFIRHRMLNTKGGASKYWKQTVWPWLQAYWPRDAARQTENTKSDFAMIAVYSDELFPSVLKSLEENGLLGETPTATTILHSLHRDSGERHEDFKTSSTLPERFPAAVIHLLSLSKPFQWDHGYGRQILNRISAVDPALVQTAEFQALDQEVPH